PRRSAPPPGAGRRADLVEAGRGHGDQLLARRQQLRAQAGRLPRVHRGDQAARHLLAAGQREPAAERLMAGRPLRVLLVEDSEDDAQLVLRALRQGGFTPTHRRVDDAVAMGRALDEPWDLILSDFSIPGFGAMQAYA